MTMQAKVRTVAAIAVVSAGVVLAVQAQQATDAQQGAAANGGPTISARGPHRWPEMPLEQRIERARRIVADFTQRPIADELRFVAEEWTLKPYSMCVLELAETGEHFDVRECEDGGVRWWFGRSAPDVGVSPTDQEAFERAFCARFFPEVPANRLVQFREHRWAELLDRQVVFAAQQCFFRLVAKEGPYIGCAKFTAAVRTDPVPRINLQEARRRAVAYIAGWPGVRSARLSIHQLKVPDPRASMAASLDCDDLGVQRLCYYCNVSIEPTNPDQGEVFAPFHDVFVWVDAVTGVCSVPTLVSPWASSPDDRHLTCQLRKPQGHDSWLGLMYEPRLVDGRVYFCGRYLDSYLWGGSYAFDRESGSFTAVFGGHTWRGKVGDRNLDVDGVLETHPAAPLRIEEEVYLPAEMIERITGWRVRRVEGLNEAGGVELVDPALDAAPETERKQP